MPHMTLSSNTGYTTHGALDILHMKRWIYHIWSIGYTTYGALDIPHKRHWIYHIWSIGYTTYGALDIPHKRHWIYHIWSIGYTTYGALDIPHKRHWIYHIWSTGYYIWSTEYTTYRALDRPHMEHLVGNVWSVYKALYETSMKLYMTFRSCTKCSVTDSTDFYEFCTIWRFTLNFWWVSRQILKNGTGFAINDRTEIFLPLSIAYVVFCSGVNRRFGSASYLLVHEL